MHINEDGLKLLKQYEGCRLSAYPDPGTGGAPWTIGYGHCGPEVKPSLKIDLATAEGLLKADLVRFEKGVENCLKVTVNDNQFSALVCFSYNLGLLSLQRSKLLIKLNTGDVDGAADEFSKWTKAAGKVLPGLVVRREAERELFLRGLASA